MAGLIYADALMEEAYDLDKKHGTDVWHTSDIEYLVMAQPTVDAVPVVHGYDTGRCRIFQCSICGYGVNDIFQEDERNYPVGEFNYCPNCGAKMDGDGNA